jgi:hypothetical protein
VDMIREFVVLAIGGLIGILLVEGAVRLSAPSPLPQYRPAGHFETLLFPSRTPGRYAACLNCMDFGFPTDCSRCAHGGLR